MPVVRVSSAAPRTTWDEVQGCRPRRGASLYRQRGQTKQQESHRGWLILWLLASAFGKEDCEDRRHLAEARAPNNWQRHCGKASAHATRTVLQSKANRIAVGARLPRA